jgi:hypothetical protein
VCARACGFKIKNQSECIIVVIGEVFFETRKFAEFLFLVLCCSCWRVGRAIANFAAERY